MCRALVVVCIVLRVEAQRLTKWSAVLTLVGQWTGKSQDQSESERNRHLVCSPLFVHKKTRMENCNISLCLSLSDCTRPKLYSVEGFCVLYVQNREGVRPSMDTREEHAYFTGDNAPRRLARLCDSRVSLQPVE